MKRWADQGIYFRKTYVAFVCFWENRENCPFGHIADSFLPFLRDESPFIRKAAALKFVFQENCIENTTADFLVCNFFEKFVTKSLGVATNFFQIFVTPRMNFLQFSLRTNFNVVERYIGVTIAPTDRVRHPGTALDTRGEFF